MQKTNEEDIDRIAHSVNEGRVHQRQLYRRMLKSGYRTVHNNLMEKYNPLKDERV